jgi:hypothetical protein
MYSGGMRYNKCDESMNDKIDSNYFRCIIAENI